MTTENYYIHINDFGDLEKYPQNEIMPKDVKRIFKYCDHLFTKRIYFFSESEKMFYRYYQNDDKYVFPVYSRPTSKKSETAYLIPDENENKRVSICISQQFINRVKNLSKIELERLRQKVERKTLTNDEKVMEMLHFGEFMH